MQRRVLVACEKGPLASELINNLLREDRRVVVVGDLQMNSSRNFEGLPNHFGLELTNLQQPLPEMTNIDQLYHLACPTRDQYEEDPIQALESCFMGTKNLLDVALRCNARVVLANSLGSGNVSSGQAEHVSWDDRLRRKRKRSVESTEFVKPAGKRRRTKTLSVPSISKSFYEEGNRLAEMLCSAYEQHFGLEVRIAHVPEDYHPRICKGKGRDDRVLELVASTKEPTSGLTDTTVVETVAQDRVLRELMDLMEAPGPETALSNEAGRAKSPLLLSIE